MVIKSNAAEQEADKAQLQLVVKTPGQKRQEVANLIAAIKIKKIERQRILGQAKTVKNEIDELWDKAEKLAAECATGQVKLDLEAMLAEVDTDEAEETKSEFLQSLEDSLDEAADRDNDEGGV